MKHKLRITLDILGFITIMWGLAIGYILLIDLIGFNDQIMIFIILPLPIVIAIYEYLHIKQTKKAYKQAHTLYDIEIARLDKQIANYITLDNVRIGEIRKQDVEITELIKELAEVGKMPPFKLSKEVIEKLKDIKEVIPFNQDNDTTEEIVLCECGKEMRECKTMYVCDWCKKRIKKEVE